MEEEEEEEEGLGSRWGLCQSSRAECGGISDGGSEQCQRCYQLGVVSLFQRQGIIAIAIGSFLRMGVFLLFFTRERGDDDEALKLREFCFWKETLILFFSSLGWMW